MKKVKRCHVVAKQQLPKIISLREDYSLYRRQTALEMQTCKTTHMPDTINTCRCLRNGIQHYP